MTVVAVEGASVEEFVTVLSVGCGAPDGAEDVLVYRLPGERLGFGLKFEGGTSTSEKVRRLFIQSCAPDSPASRAHCSWGSLQEGDEVLEIDSVPVTAMTRLDCVRSLKESHVVIKLLVRHPAPPPIPPRRKAQSAAVLGPPTAFADVPPEPEVYLDLLAQEELNCLTDTGSDDTGSSISTVLGPFDQLEEETLQPPLSFQDAPLSYGDEKVLPPKPAPRKDVQARFRSGKKRPPPPPPPRSDRPQCPLNVQTIAVVDMDRGDLPRLVDVVPKAFLETEEMQSSALLVEDFAEDRPVIAGWEENRPAGTGGEPTSSTAVERAVLPCEGENTSQVNESRQALARNEEGGLAAAAANGEENVSVATENRPVDADVVPARSENADSTVAMTDVRVEGDGKVVEMQENGFLGEEYKSIGLQNEDPVILVLDTAEGRPANRGSKGGKMMDRPAGVESEENRSARIDSSGNRPMGAWRSKNSSLKTGSMDNSLLITRIKDNSSVVIDSKGNRPEGTHSQEYTLRETCVKENRAVVTDSNCSSPVLNGSDGEVSVLSDMEENWLSGIMDEGKRPQMPHVGEDTSGVTDTNGNVELRLVEEIRSMETTLKENGHVKTDEKEYMHVEEDPKENSHVETEMKKNRIMETSMKEERHTVAKNEDCNPVWTESKENNVLTERSVLSDNQGNSDLVSRDNESKAVETEGVDNSPALEGRAENSPLETDRKDDMPVLKDSNESSSLVMQYVENNSVVIDTVDKRSAGAEIEESFSVGTVSVENNSVLSCGKGTSPVLTEDIPGAASKEHSNVVIKNEESIAVVTGNAESEAAGADRTGNLAICQDNRPVVCKSLRTWAEESKENMNVKVNRPVERGTGTAETERLPEVSSQEAGVTPKPSVELACLEVQEDAFMVAVPQRQDLHSDSDEEDFLLNLPELELLEQGGTVFQPATGALLTASDAFFPFRCWGPTSHLATIGEDEEDDVTNQG